MSSSGSSVKQDKCSACGRAVKEVAVEAGAFIVAKGSCVVKGWNGRVRWASCIK